MWPSTRRSDGISHSDAVHIAFDGPNRLGLRNVTYFVAQSPTPSDHCVRFAPAVADDCATLASRRCATTLPGPVFHRRTASASPDALGPRVRIPVAPAASHADSLGRAPRRFLTFPPLLPNRLFDGARVNAFGVPIFERVASHIGASGL